MLFRTLLDDLGLTLRHARRAKAFYASAVLTRRWASLHGNRKAGHDEATTPSRRLMTTAGNSARTWFSLVADPTGT
jgi:hypothetical protein